MSKARTVEDFKSKHDPRTVIRRLEADLAEAQKNVGMQEAIERLLGLEVARSDKSPIPAWVAAPLAKSSSPGVPTLFLSDLHWGERVSKAELGGINEYSLAIAHSRLEHTVETAVHLLRILSPELDYPGIVVPLGGDMISGNIHEELMATNELNTMPTVFDLYEALVGAFKLIADTFGKVLVPCVSGNHGRDTKKTWAKSRNNTSFDWLLYKFLAHHFKGDERFTFYIPAGSDALYRVGNTRYLMTHGDQFKSGDSIIGPIGPIFRGRQKKLARNQAVEQPFDVMILGHWHQYIHTETIIVNGSMKGYDEYAAAGNFSYEVPRQALWLTHPRHGVTFRMPVACAQPSAKPAAAWASVPK